MPTHSSYLLRLMGTTTDSKLAGAFTQFFGSRPHHDAGVPDQKPGQGWPDGFLLQGYETCVWEPGEEPAPDGQGTLLSFRAEAHRIRSGSLFANRATMVPEVQWFYHSLEYRWHMDLKAWLQQSGYAIKFHTWQWYCGDGGGW